MNRTRPGHPSAICGSMCCSEEKAAGSTESAYTVYIRRKACRYERNSARSEPRCYEHWPHRPWAPISDLVWTKSRTRFWIDVASVLW